MRKIPLPAVKNAAQKGHWPNASARKGNTPGSNRGRRSKTAICIYGLKEKIRARKSPEALQGKTSEVFCGSSQIVVCAPDAATPVFIILTTSLSVPLLYGAKRKASPIQTCQKSAFCVHFACAIMPLSTVRRFAPPYQDAPKPVYTPTVQISKSSISCVSTSAYCSACRFGFPDESSST